MNIFTVSLWSLVKIAIIGFFGFSDGLKYLGIEIGITFVFSDGRVLETKSKLEKLEPVNNEN